MSVPFYLEKVPDAGATLRVVGRGDGAPKQIKIQISVNELILIDGPSPFRYDEFESRDFSVPPANLRVGANLMTVRNMEDEGPLGNRPHFIVSEAGLIPSH